jgi:predicted ABC-type ATPase
MPNLYIIAGCNGAGKTTASFTVLPEMLACREFVNADEVAKGLSPFQPEKVAFEAGRIMLNRIRELINLRKDFGIRNFFSLYQVLVDNWIFYNSSHQSSDLLAEGTSQSVSFVYNSQLWNQIKVL